MKPMKQFTIITLFAASLALPAFAQTPASLVTPDKVESRIGTLEFKDGAPSAETLAKVYARQATGLHPRV